MLMEVYRDPDIPRADRINAILDYVFGRFPGQGSRERNRDVLRLLMKRLNDITSLDQAQYTNTNPQPYIGPTLIDEPNIIPDMAETYVPWQWSPMTDLAGGPGSYASAPNFHNWTSIPSTKCMSEDSQNSYGAITWSSG